LIIVCNLGENITNVYVVQWEGKKETFVLGLFWARERIGGEGK
jgi:hypothetical protein